MPGISLVDPGMTTVDDSGQIKFSPQAQLIRPNFGYDAQEGSIGALSPSASPQIPAGINSVIPGPGTMPANTPKYSGANTQMAMDMLKDTLATSYTPQYQHGVGGFLSRLGSGLTGLSRGMRGEEVESYNPETTQSQRARATREGRIKELEPVAKLEQEEQTQRRLGEQSAASLASAESHRKAVEDLTRQQREIERKKQEDIETKNATDAERKSKEFTEKIKTDTEKARHNKTNEGISSNKTPIDRRADELLNKKNRGEILSAAEQAELKSFYEIKEGIPTRTGEARARAFGQNRPVVVENPQKPGETIYEPAEQAERVIAATPQSTDFQVLRQNALANVPTSVTRTMAQFSKLLEPQMKDAIKQVDQIAKEIGPGAGRWNELWVNKAGLNDPKFAALNTQLKLLATGVIKAHNQGRINEKWLEALEKDFGAAQSPENLKARITAADKFIVEYSHALDSTTPNKVRDPREEVTVDDVEIIK